MSDFKLNASATKKDIIDQYNELLHAHKKAVRERVEAAKRLTEVEKQSEAQSLEIAQEATVQSVINNVGHLRAQLGATLNDLTDRMSAQAEKLESYKQAIGAQKNRLKELQDIDSAADALAKLVLVYEERRDEAETEFENRLAEMKLEHDERKTTAEFELTQQRENLEQATNTQRAKWIEEQKQYRKSSEEEEERTKQDREREETEYIYNRDRSRKLEQDEYDEKKRVLGKDLEITKEEADKAFSQREITVAQREKRLGDLDQQVERFPERLETTVAEAVKKATAEVADKAKQKEEMLVLERDWEKKMYEQNISHLKEVIAAQENKVSSLGAELAKAQAQVNEVAKKAIEGASLNKAFQSVNKIALEQARQHETTSSD